MDQLVLSGLQKNKAFLSVEAGNSVWAGIFLLVALVIIVFFMFAGSSRRSK